MSWSTKEKFCLLINILEFGDQNESWTQISNDLNRKFLSNSKFSIKVCSRNETETEFLFFLFDL